jgi:hypothetical protein
MEKTLTPHIALQLAYDEEPYVVRFIRSGWSNPRLYHVIIEYGDMDQSEYVGTIDASQIKKRFNVDIDLENDSLKNIVRNQPNDQLLGQELRDKIYSLIKTVKS